MSKFRASLPSAKLTVVVLIVCTAVGLLSQGFNPDALLVGLVLSLGFLILIILVNYDPDRYVRVYRPNEYRLRTERNDLFNSLKGLTEAIESSASIHPDSTLGTKAAEARHLLDTISGRTTVVASSDERKLLIAVRLDPTFCMGCGVQMLKAGSCFACPSCGATSGCD